MLLITIFNVSVFVTITFVSLSIGIFLTVS